MSHPIVKRLFALELQSKCTYRRFIALLCRTTCLVFKRKEVNNQQIVSGMYIVIIERERERAAT